MKSFQEQPQHSSTSETIEPTFSPERHRSWKERAVERISDTSKTITLAALPTVVGLQLTENLKVAGFDGDPVKFAKIVLGMVAAQFQK